MSEELSTLLQVMQLYGRGLEGLGKAIRFSSKGVKKGVDFATLKKMQIKMKLHYASVGKHKTMKLKDLEKLTNGKYSIYNIPIEDEELLMSFYDRLKKLKVSFAELPDLQLGDGYTQIAFNPLDADKVELVVNYFRKKFKDEAREITLDEYIQTGGKEGEELLTELAKKGYTDAMHEEHLLEFKEKLKDKRFVPISVNLDSLLVREEKDSYIIRLPMRGRAANDGMKVRILKKDVLLFDEGKTCLSFFEKDSRITVFAVDDRGVPLKKSEMQVSSDMILSRFAEVGKDRIRLVNKLKDNNPDIFPNFNKGQESTIEASLPDFNSGEVGLEHMTLSDKIVSIMDRENLKSMSQDENFYELNVNAETQLVAEQDDFYIVNVPGISKDDEEIVDCMIIPKSRTRVADGGDRIIAYLKKTDRSTIHSFNVMGEKVKTVEVNNMDVIRAYVKEDIGTSRTGKIHGFERKDILEKFSKELINKL